MKKLLSITLAIMVLISVWSTGMFGITASAATVTSGTNLVEVATSATNYDKLRNYIFTYGIKDENEQGELVEGITSSSGSTTVYYSLENTDSGIVFSILAVTGTKATQMILGTTSFTLSRDSKILPMETIWAYYYRNSLYDRAEKTLNIDRSEYSTSKTYNLYRNSNFFDSDDLTKLFNDSLKLLCDYWDLQMYKKLGFGLNGLGFISYSGLGNKVCDLPSSYHTGSKENRNSYAATCTTDGYTGDTYCASCGEKISSGSVIKCVGKHSYSGDCDDKCDSCGLKRKVAANHVYDSDLDAICNTCNYVRYNNVWLIVNDKHYYYDGNGVKQTGWLYFDGVYYYFNINGTMRTGWFRQNGIWYYLNADGSMAANTWVGNFWLDASGKMTVNSWVYYNGSYYYVGADGAYQTGWVYVGGAYYYLNAAGVMQTGWQYLGGSYYYLTVGGSMAANTWVGSFWLDASGKMAVNTWLYYNGVYYYVGADGAYRTGWLYLGGTYYYLNAGGVMQTGWQYIGGNWYYFYSGGSMATNCYIGNNQITASGAMA